MYSLKKINKEEVQSLDLQWHQWDIVQIWAPLYLSL